MLQQVLHQYNYFEYYTPGKGELAESVSKNDAPDKTHRRLTQATPPTKQQKVDAVAAGGGVRATDWQASDRRSGATQRVIWRNCNRLKVYASNVVKVYASNDAPDGMGLKNPAGRRSIATAPTQSTKGYARAAVGGGRAPVWQASERRGGGAQSTVLGLSRSKRGW